MGAQEKMLDNVCGLTLGRLAQNGVDLEALRRVLPGFDAKRVAVAAFQSSI